LIVGEARNLAVAIYHADPGTEYADKLALLTSAALPPSAPRSTAAINQINHHLINTSRPTRHSPIFCTAIDG
jgi:hypothetical protein